MGYRIFVALGFAILVGCSSVSYLNPIGPGKARTMSGLCPFPYRVLEVVVPESDVRIYINVFKANTLAHEAVGYLAVSDEPVHINRLPRPNGIPQRHTHKVSFPDGVAIRVSAADGRSAQVELVTVSDGAGGTAAGVLKYTLPAGSWENFGVTFPAIAVDGQRVEIGTVRFEPGQATIHGINC